MSTGSFEHPSNPAASAAFRLRSPHPMPWSLRSPHWRRSKGRAGRTRTIVSPEAPTSQSVGKRLAASWVSWLTLIIKLLRRSD